MPIKLNTPIPQTLPKECAKAAKIFKSFVDNGNNGLDGVVPRSVLEQAKGFAIFTVFKAGFLFSARAGSGIVIARLEDGSWSAPSAIGTAGLGVGGQAGAEVTDFLIVLNSRAAIRSFMAAGSLSLGGNLSIAVGPLGRNGEAMGSLSTGGKVAAMYSYSKTKGLFGGLSLEGSVIVERQDANAQAYHHDITVKALLSGTIPPPEWAQPLIQTLESCTGMPGGRKWISDRPSVDGGDYGFGGVESPRGEQAPSTPKTSWSPGSFSPFGKKKRSENSPSFPPAAWGKKKNSGSYFSSANSNDLLDDDLYYGEPELPPSLSSSSRSKKGSSTSGFETQFESDFIPEDMSKRHPHLSTVNGSSGLNDSYTPGSPFNNLPPFDAVRSSLSQNSLSQNTHGRSMSNPLLSSSQQRSNPFSHASSKSDPFELSAALASPTYSSTFENVASTPTGYRDSGYGDSERDLLEDDLVPSHTGMNNKPIRPLQVKPELSTPLQEGVGRAIALFDFHAEQSGDLSFNKGDVITIIEKSDNRDAWWTGKLNGRNGIFPANRVEVV